MINNSILKRPCNGLLFLLVACLLFIAMGCQSSKPEGKTKKIPFKNNSEVYTKWNDIFENDTVIPLTFNEPSLEIYKIGFILEIPDGGYIIIDTKAKKNIHFDASGRFVRYIGGIGAGPGELGLGWGRPYLDHNKNFYLYDIPQHRINKYTFPDYSFEKFFQMPSAIQKYIFDEKGNFILYTVSDPSVLQKVAPNGKIMQKAFQVNNLNFRMFSARFQIGRLDEIPGEGFLFSYPEEYKVFYFDYDLNIKKEFYPITYSRFFPEKAVFPVSLAPTDFTPVHSKWWGSALRPAKIFYLGNGLFIQELCEFTNSNSKTFLNLHDIDGITYAIGVEVPFDDAMIHFAINGHIFVVEDSIFDEAGKTTMVKLHRYKLKNSIFSKSK